MLPNLHFRSLCVLIILLPFCVSCESDDPNDNEPPLISIVSPEPNVTVWNTIEVSVQLDEPLANIREVRYYLDGELIQPVSDEPFGLALNTRNYEDGVYSLGVKAIDNAGNESEEVRQEINLLNTLLDIEIREGYYPPGSDVFLYVTAADGTMIELVNLDGEKEIKIERPGDFEDERIGFHELVYENELKYRLTTYLGLKPGKIMREWLSPSLGAIKGFAEIALNDDFVDTGLQVGNALQTFTPSYGQRHVSTATYEKNDKAYAYLLGEGSKGYVILEGLLDGQRTTLGPGDFQTDIVDHTIDVSAKPGMHVSHVRVKGFFEDGFYSDGLHVFSAWLDAPDQMSSSYDFYTPGARMFQNFSSTIRVKDTTNNTQYENVNFGRDNLADFEYPEMELDLIDPSIRSFSGSVTGNYDFIMVRWMAFNRNENSSISTQQFSVLCQDAKNLVIPSIPVEIADKYPGLSLEQFLEGNDRFFLPQRTVQVIDYDNLTSIDDYYDRHLRRIDARLHDGVSSIRQAGFDF